MKMAVVLVGLYASCTLGATFHPKTCPAVIFNAKSGTVRTGKNYVNGKAAGPNDILYISDLTGKGISQVRVPANKNNWAADIIIKDGIMVIESGASYSVPQMVFDCKGSVDCVSDPLGAAKTAFNYANNKPASCGKKKCAKTCNGHHCDYWNAEEDYSCKSLEDEYSCDCFGCKCKIDHIPCDNKLAKKKCNGKTCDQWVLSNGVSCALLEKDFKCSCIGCKCPSPPICDAKAIKKCTDAYKIPCTAGKKGSAGVKCGGCAKGYKSNGKGDCDAVTVVIKKDKCGKLMKGKCGSAAYVGDGHCDDNNNNAACGWDKGDCCGNNGKAAQFNYCKKCACKDCAHKTKGDACIKAMKGKCGAKAYKGDGNCDDNNNNAACSWDGGDCCGTSVKKTYCKQCKCLDCTYKGKGDSCVKVAKKSCKFKAYKKDGNCDDENNNAGCAWDGGDCCGNKVKKTYCKKCLCLDCTKQKKCPKKGVTCGAGAYVGDGNCDDNNNSCGCGWDNGDCCGPKVKKTYCKVCKCLDPNYKAPACGAPAYKKDGNCDDENNNKGCQYDGGDCCGPKVKKSYCKVCKCLDPNYKAPKCGSPAYKKDGNCDDENNNKDCQYDGGDCCGAKVKKTYCKVCKCLDPNYKPGCGTPAYKGDGNCDDDNNLKNCAWDGGDCCLSPKKTTYCKKCLCLDPAKQNNKCKGGCGSKAYVKDGNCDDENNNCGCKYDGGDCCDKTVKGGKVKKTYCVDCSCVDPKQKRKCNGKCAKKAYQGDGNCDDGNNNCGCNYDGGDCCPTKKRPKVSKTYCQVCKCITG